MTVTFTGLLLFGYVGSNVIKMNVCFGKGCKYLNSVLSSPIDHPVFIQRLVHTLEGRHCCLGL